MRIMLTGANGQVGWELSRSLMPLGEVVPLTRAQCDLSRPETLPAIVNEIKPDIIVNAAAYTAVDKAEEEEELATIINGTSVGVLAEEAKKHDAILVHYSTDYVFDGTKSEPYTEEDTPNPINAYGRSKLAGEEAIRQVGGKHFIFRTSWVYSSRGNNFLRTILRLLGKQNQLNIINNQYGAPTWARNIADTTILAIAKYNYCDSKLKLFGLYNMTASGDATWFDFANEIVMEAIKCGLIKSNKNLIVRPIPASDYKLPATRPQNSRLCNKNLRKTFNASIPDWRISLTKCINEIAKGI